MSCWPWYTSWRPLPIRTGAQHTSLPASNELSSKSPYPPYFDSTQFGQDLYLGNISPSLLWLCRKPFCLTLGTEDAYGMAASSRSTLHPYIPCLSCFASLKTMCQIFDVVYHFCSFCGSMLEKRIDNCPDEAFAGLCEDLCLHISNRITEQESLDLFCPTRFHISRHNNDADDLVATKKLKTWNNFDELA